MNLIKTQQELNALPPTPESLQYLAGAAQGQLVNVPPWLALSRMNEINRQIESAKNSAAQPPTETLSDSIPQNLEQNLGMAPQAGPPGQGGMPMAAGPQGGPPQGGMFPAQGAPQGADMAMAPQSAGPTQMMASGGIAGIPVNPDMFEYGSGGIVAFAGGGIREDVDPTLSPPAVRGRALPPVVEPIPTGANQFDPMANYQMVNQRALDMINQRDATPDPKSPEETRTEMQGKGNYGIDSGPIGEEALKAKKAIAEARKAENALQQKNMNAAKQMAVWKAFMDAGAATKGQYGAGALMGGFGSSFAKSTDDILGKESELRLSNIKQDELLNDAAEVVQKLRRAQLDGDVAAEYKHKAEFAKLAKDNRISERTLLGHLVTTAGMVAGKDVSADASMYGADVRGATVRAGAGKITPAMNAAEAIAAKVTELRAADPTLTPTAARTKAEEWYKSLAAAPGITSREDLDLEKAIKTFKYTADYLQSKDKKKAIEDFVKERRIRMGQGIASPSSAAAPGRMRFDANGAPITAP